MVARTNASAVISVGLIRIVSSSCFNPDQEAGAGVPMRLPTKIKQVDYNIAVDLSRQKSGFNSHTLSSFLLCNRGG